MWITKIFYENILTAEFYFKHAVLTVVTKARKLGSPPDCQEECMKLGLIKAR